VPLDFGVDTASSNKKDHQVLQTDDAELVKLLETVKNYLIMGLDRRNVPKVEALQSVVCTNQPNTFALQP